MAVFTQEPQAEIGDARHLYRLLDLVELGFSAETIAIIAVAPVELADITKLLLPDAPELDHSRDRSTSSNTSVRGSAGED
jgi:hypothetical protein